MPKSRDHGTSTEPPLKRILTVLIALVVGLPILLWASFRIWLVNQPPAFRAQIEQFSTLEFIGVMRNAVFPVPFADRGEFGRRAYPGRGHSPWVLRSSLDGRPRILAIAIAPERWLAYSTQTASIHQLWQGDVDYTGPVYDAHHGFEPTSRGVAYLQPVAETAWHVRDDGGWRPAEIRWRGHGFDPGTGALWLRFDVSDGQGGTRSVTEWPDSESPAPSSAGATESTLHFERRFELASGPEIGLRVGSLPESASIEADLALDRREEFLVFGRQEIDARLAIRFQAPEIELAFEDTTEEANDPFARHDCHSCHNVRERVVGPAWSEIALRYVGANREITTSQLARRIREGSVGQWGNVAMLPHPDLHPAEARRLAAVILETPASEAPVVAIADSDAGTTWTFTSDTAPPPDRLHPALTSTPIDPPHFTPKVGGLAWLPDGRLAVSTWDRDGSVFAVAGWQGPVANVRVQRIAEGLHEPLGLASVGDDLYVMQKQEVTQLLDHDGDGWTDEYRTIADGWQATSNFHEFGFGLVARGDDLFAALGACVLTGGKSCRDQTPHRGRVLRISRHTGAVEFLARGLRTPNGLALSPEGAVFVADNQGDWLPASKLIRVRRGAHYGWRGPEEAEDLGPVTPPTLWLPQNEVGNSPTQPLFLTTGPYAGDVLFGDVFNGGLKRAVLEEVAGELQGAAFHFSGGFEGPINRLLATPDGRGFVVGQVGSKGNWGERGKDWYGLEVVRMGAEPAFEPRRVSLRPGGFDVEFTRPLEADLEIAPSDVELRDWYYVPAAIYGGPKYDVRALEVSRVDLSADGRTLSIDVVDLKPERIVYLQLGDRFRSDRGEQLWVNEAWYTLNSLPVEWATPKRIDRQAVSAGPPTPPTQREREGPPTTPTQAEREGPPNTLTQAERDAGWRLLFDGESFAGWKVYGAEDDVISHWTIDDQALHFTRDVSFAGLIWNHLNPFTPAAIDLMTRERLQDFELSVDWRISPGGNSGIFYAVPDESASLSWDQGLEMQVLDDAGHWDGEIERHRAGDLYDLQSLARATPRPVGEWNRARIRVRGDRVEHWLNGVQTVDLLRGGPQWEKALAASKFADTEDFGRARLGHITLQDHGDLVWFRNLKIRPLDIRP